MWLHSLRLPLCTLFSVNVLSFVELDVFTHSDFRVWCPQPNEFMSVNPWRVRVTTPMRQKLPPVVGPYGRLVWEVVTCHLRNWSHSFECSFAQWAVRTLSAAGLFWFFLSFGNFLLPVPLPVQTVATACAIPAFATRSQHCTSAVPGGLRAVLSDAANHEGKERREKWEMMSKSTWLASSFMWVIFSLLISFSVSPD